MARKKAAKKKAAKKSAKKGPARTSARGAQPKSKMSGRTGTKRRSAGGPKKSARTAKPAPQRKRGVKAGSAAGQGRGQQRATAPKERGAKSRQAQPQKAAAATGRSRGQAERTAPKKTKSDTPPRSTRNAAGSRNDDRQRPQEPSSAPPRGDSKRRRGPTGARREIQGGLHAEEQGVQQAQGRWDNEQHMSPAPARRHRQQQSENIEPMQQMGGPEGDDSGFQGPSPEAEDLDQARRHTTIGDQSADEGYGRSEGADNRRLSQMGEYGADDDEQHFGRNLGGRNRIPGAGSRRNR